jgi:hypothetical protein
MSPTMNTNSALKLLASSILLIIVIAATCCPMQAAAQAPGAQAASGAHDFDFVIGKWDLKNWRLKRRHVGSNEWEEFPAHSETQALLGGKANLDEIHFPTKGWSGVTLRLYRPDTQDWAIYWANSRDGQMGAPVVGKFVDGVGEFFGEDTDDGKPILVRYRWTRIDRDHAHWEQAFSLDAGKTWETNWKNDLTRTVAP